MTYIITDPCVGTCDTACIEVCPVDCIHGPNDPEGSGEEAKAPDFDATSKQLFINPDHFLLLIALVTLGTPASASVPSSSAAASAAASVSFVPVAILSISIFCAPIDGFPVRLLLVASNEFK